jgi:chromosomal replication initiation ATPase DnaA
VEYTPDELMGRLRRRMLVPIVEEVCETHAVTIGEVLGGSKPMRIARARQAVCWRLRHHPTVKMSYPDIGTLLGLDHTTVMRNVRAHQSRLDEQARGDA